MNDTNRIGDSPRSVIVVGAGIIGLSTAWFLQDRGVAVTVVDRSRVAAGASWGNAGWISPGLAIPLHVPASVNPRLWAFLARFAAHSTDRSWGRAVRANLPLNNKSQEAFDVLTADGVAAPTVDAPITAAVRTAPEAEGWHVNSTGSSRPGSNSTTPPSPATRCASTYRS